MALAAPTSPGAVLALTAIAVHGKQRKRRARCASFTLASIGFAQATDAQGRLVQVTGALAVRRATGCAALRKAPLPPLRRTFYLRTGPKQARYRRFAR